ncbi:MAG: pyridoxamine 5'-phosphate oxidase family protein [Micropruina sp.]
MLTPDAVSLFSRSVLCWLSTVGDDGWPSVSPKEIFVASSPTQILIADIASPRSVRNITANPRVCVAAVDVFEQHGYQAYGRARIVAADPNDRPDLVVPLRRLVGDAFPIRAVICVEVDRVTRILAPSVWMYPDVPRGQRREGALKAYGVRDRDAE